MADNEINLTAIFDLVREIGDGAKTYRDVLDEAKSTVSRAEERLRLVLAIGDACEATKTRKPRKDKGTKRVKPSPSLRSRPAGAGAGRRAKRVKPSSEPESITPGGSESGSQSDE